MTNSVYLRKSGLVVAEESADEAALWRALNQEIDDRLILTREVDRKHQTWVWQVRVMVSTTRCDYVCDWRDQQGRPLPLSSGLLERVREQFALRDQPGHGLDVADKRNAALVADIDRQIDEASTEAARLVAKFGGSGHSGLLKRGVGLRQARERTREASASRKRLLS